MKTPLSPAQLMENSPPYFPVTELMDGMVNVSTQERKKLLYSLCEVCNIQLNSAAQVQTHYNGKSHLRRVKQLNNGESPPASSSSVPNLLTTTITSSSTGSSCHSNTLPALVRTPPLMMQSTLDMKPFMPFPVDGSSPVGLFANFSTMDPVQKAVINHTFGVSIPPKKKQVISCNICQLRFNSDNQAEAHYKGSKHAKKLKAQESTKTKQKGGAGSDNGAKPISTGPSPAPASSAMVTDSTSDQSAEKSPESPSAPKAPVSPRFLVPASPLASGTCKPNPAPSSSPAEHKASPKPSQAEPSAESEEEKAKKLLYCSLCKVAVNSLSQLEAHNTGSKHKTMLEARNGAGPIKAYPRPGSKLKMQANVLKGSGLQNKTFHCEICDVHVNSEIQLKQHISSRRHKDRVAGKPLKPKYSPYNKQQRSSNSLAAKLALRKDVVKPISPAFISSPFSSTTIPSISLHPRPNTSIFQSPALPASFLRGAPGPIRPSSSSILFAPY
ncbi:zinc finger protein 385B isoform X2 [Ictalurus punctatus]|uniref:Zinc finger protein 385B n=1 Tax=Ictalurus punctatus TaxID=7998 RepID=A0A979EWG8_ICTPU|nr:zinc finger protein 385B isoform X2 [Ictalurus punctatus]XP_047012165.1 zinc finger protein 385B isoform X2 [Ictalurus punctatus]